MIPVVACRTEEGISAESGCSGGWGSVSIVSVLWEDCESVSHISVTLFVVLGIVVSTQVASVDLVSATVGVVVVVVVAD